MKSKAHILMANILREEILKNGGVIIDGKLYKLPVDSMIAIRSYGNYFRAGAVGPDFFPDLLFGQMKIHPDHSGIWLDRMRDVLARYNRASKDYYPAYAFYLGYLTHYATDLFGHEDVNYYSLGYFPDIKSLFDKLIKIGSSKKGAEDLSIIVRHMAFEAYMDSKITDENLEIEVPFDYIKKCFGNTEAYEFMKKNELDGGLFNVLPQFLKKYQESIGNNNLREAEKRDEYINGWFNIWSTFVKMDLNGNFSKAYNATEDVIIGLIVDYLCAYGDIDGLRDGFNTTCTILGIIGDPLLYLVSQGLSTIFDPIKNAITRFFKEVILKNLLTGIVLSLGGKAKDILTLESEKNFLINFLKVPARILDGNAYFKEHNLKVKELAKSDIKFRKYLQKEKVENPHFTNYLNYKWGNFGKERRIEKQDYVEFKRCLKMGLLTMLGANNQNELFFDKVCVAPFKSKIHPFHGASFERGIYTINVDITMKDCCGAGTNADLYLNIVSGNRTYSYLLDKFFSDDFERNSQNRFTIRLPRFEPFKELKSFKLVMKWRKVKSDEADFEDVCVTDADTGMIVARNGNFTLNDKKSSMGITLASNLDVTSKEISEHSRKNISGVYAIFHTNYASRIARDFTLELTSNSKNSTKTESITLLKKSLINSKYYSIFGTKDDITKISHKLYGVNDFYDVSFYEATGFLPIGRNARIKSDEKWYRTPFNFKTAENYGNGSTSELVVVVKTSDNLYSGTDDWVDFSVVLYDGTVIEKTLDTADYNDFEAGDIDAYTFRLDKLVRYTDIKEFRIHKRTDKELKAWTVDFIAVLDTNRLQTLCYHQMPGSTVLSGTEYVIINDGYWKRLLMK